MRTYFIQSKQCIRFYHIYVALQYHHTYKVSILLTVTRDYTMALTVPVEQEVGFAARGVSRFGPAVRRLAGKQRDVGSNPLLLSFLFKSCDLWTLSL